MSSHVGCLLLFLKIYVLKIGGNCRGKYQDNGKIEIFKIPERLAKIIAELPRARGRSSIAKVIYPFQKIW